jgi:hypothetical protein
MSDDFAPSYPYRVGAVNGERRYGVFAGGDVIATSGNAHDLEESLADIRGDFPDIESAIDVVWWSDELNRWSAEPPVVPVYTADG